MEYVVREYNLPESFGNENDEPLEVTLEREYDYIYNSMIVEGYRIRFNEYSIFSEILFEGKVVGFATYWMHIGNNLSLNEVFILPDFRGNQLFKDEIFRMIRSGVNLSFNEPTRRLVEILIHYNLAVKLNDTLVASTLTFDITDEHMIYHGDFDVSDLVCSVNLYDLKLCSPIFLDDISTPGVCNIAYQEFQSADDEYEDCARFRQSTDLDEYFLEFKNDFLKNSDEYVRVLMNLKENMPSDSRNYEIVFGDGEDLSDYVWSMIDKNLIDEDDARGIIAQLKRDYDEGIVSDDGLITRLSYMVSDEDFSSDDDLFFENLSKNRELCPYCRQPVNRSDSHCRICGYDISDGELLNFDEVIRDIILENDNVIDLRGEALDEFIRDNPLQSDDEVFWRLWEIYHNNDEEGFREILEEYDIGISQISQIADLEDRVMVDLSHLFSGMQVEYMRNYSVSCRIIDKDKKIKQHSLGDEITIKKPAYSLRMCLKELEKNPDIEKALGNADIKMDRENVKHALFYFDLIESRRYGEDFWQHIYNTHKVSELKEFLRNNNLKVSGNKIDLVLRLKENMLYTELGEREFKLTGEGEHFLIGTSWIDTYDDFMDTFSFEDFEDYLLKNEFNGFLDGAISYLNRHLQIGYQKKDFRRLHDVFSAKSIIYLNEGEFKKALVEELQLYMLRTNPVFLTGEQLESYMPLEYSNINNINVLSSLEGIFNLKKIFDRAWGLMKFEKRLVSKKNSLKILNMALEGEDLDELSDEMKKKYFKA